ncbi:MAG TPA: exodeoxyribonuclease VII large subunit [Candidatus Limnocylindrales bacterium]|nr:exodeoxyribonuclease VII large subunit [Candidatus Limnocylindrales bacterium]
MSRPSEPDWLLPAWDAVPEDPDERPTRAPVPGGTIGLRVRSVSEVSRAIRERIRADDGLRDLWVEGEVGRVTVSTAGHAYFTLKDARAQLQCVWFRDERVRSPFQPQTGLQVVAHGRMDVFEPQGALQLYVESLQPSGFGNLAVRFEQLKAALAAEGLFDTARKRPLPRQPATIAVITSPTGAVWRDVCTVLARRWPMTRVVLVACRVQGDGAAASIVTAFRRLERWVGEMGVEGRAGEAPAVTILARGGGSLEDLWSFNDERVVRAVVGHPLPVVCGVGHEVDVTLADFAADVRAATPSAAAELVVPDRMEVAGSIAAIGRRAEAASVRRIGAVRRDLDAEHRALDRLEPRAQLAASRERAGLLLDRAARAVAERLGTARRGEERLSGRLIPVLPRRLDLETRRVEALGLRAPRVMQVRLASARASLAASRASLAALGPQATLDRGYAIVRRSGDGSIVRRPSDAPAGTPLAVALAEGRLAATSDGLADADGAGERS